VYQSDKLDAFIKNN